MSEYDNVPGAKEALEDEANKPIRIITKTEAEKKFQEVQRKRLDEKVEKAARKSHKERVAELNRKLEEMTEHYDIPKVSWSYNLVRFTQEIWVH
ncbi:5465_t:CDS:2 [Cetraspora pellucida]|uniref:5465_t:CDS:1 n=1 Tax=Cetraspora pellucida TaxID=1433469 RepID=A0A9N9BH02_9GLOM|nr:5465_t:CDS:2 [Cetraspora pellucida]